MEWMLMPLKRYAEFSGRSRRKEFWMYSLLNLIVMVVCYGVILSSIGMGMTSFDEAALMSATGGPMVFLFGGILVLWVLATLIPNIAVSVRRLHDRDMSGWWYLGFIVLAIIPLVGLIASIAFIVIMALDGTTGPNRFGSDPKGRADAELFS